MANAGAKVFLCFAAWMIGTSALGFLRPIDQGPPAPQPTPVPGSPSSVTPGDIPGAHPNPFYDPSNPDLARLQNAREVAKQLPQDRDGRIDWMTALRSGSITPRSQLRGETGSPPLDLDIIMKRTRQMPFVRFPHRSHTEWLACSNCHPAIFEARAGSTTIRMEDIFRGRYCGTCHDRVAFVTHRACDRCHSVPNDGRGG